jgi:hypothetical protein
MKTLTRVSNRFCEGLWQEGCHGVCMRISGLVKATALLFIVFSLPMHAQRAATTVLALTVGSQCGVSVLSSSHSEVSGGPAGEYTGTITFVYYVRTSTAAGSGNIELELVDDSSQSGNSSGMAVSYTTDLSGVGSANSGRQTVSSSSTNITVASFGADQHSPRQGNTGTINWTFNRDAMSSNTSLPPTPHLNMSCR